eukprot:CAMPEP_0116937808 /NCGR_PEP_ID=MMETSP0467-20121206/31718_1 /TAXON_ID=283647 /ORGANISM="Mesodinium pulex, Strain SPMC105" /LENGTH=137 /DNA_ID=CAMNT_0004619681 /DNA_START=93 /DNA_END=506 /DNA_ORIENTATION=+
MTVLKSALKFEQIAAASNEAELAQAVKYTPPAVDTANLPQNLKYFDSYVNSSAGAAQEPFVPNPNAWQNLPFSKFVMREYSRPHNFWILIVGPLIFLYMVNFPGRDGWYEDKEMTKNSLYYQQLHGWKFNELPGGEH